MHDFVENTKILIFIGGGVPVRNSHLNNDIRLDKRWKIGNFLLIMSSAADEFWTFRTFIRKLNSAIGFTNVCEIDAENSNVTHIYLLTEIPCRPGIYI